MNRLYLCSLFLTSLFCKFTIWILKVKDLFNKMYQAKTYLKPPMFIKLENVVLIVKTMTINGLISIVLGLSLKNIEMNTVAKNSG